MRSYTETHGEAVSARNLGLTNARSSQLRRRAAEVLITQWQENDFSPKVFRSTDDKRARSAEFGDPPRGENELALAEHVAQGWDFRKGGARSDLQ